MGEPTELHGQGFPVFVVMWDHANRYSDDPTIPDDKFIHFVSPIGFFLNPIIFLVADTILLLASELIAKSVRPFRKYRLEARANSSIPN